MTYGTGSIWLFCLFVPVVWAGLVRAALLCDAVVRAALGCVAVVRVPRITLRSDLLRAQRNNMTFAHLQDCPISLEVFIWYSMNGGRIDSFVTSLGHQLLYNVPSSGYVQISGDNFQPGVVSFTMNLPEIAVGSQQTMGAFNGSLVNIGVVDTTSTVVNITE